MEVQRRKLRAEKRAKHVSEVSPGAGRRRRNGLFALEELWVLSLFWFLPFFSIFLRCVVFVFVLETEAGRFQGWCVRLLLGFAPAQNGTWLRLSFWRPFRTKKHTGLPQKRQGDTCCGSNVKLLERYMLPI